jgi:hypothetical protein
VDSFFNSRSTRIPLAIIGGIFYGLLVYFILRFASFSDWALAISIPIAVAYFISRLLLVFSGIPSPYYSKGRETLFKSLPQRHPFRQKVRLIGTFYHYHDVALFIVMVIIGVGFIVCLFIDGIRGQPLGATLQDLRQSLFPPLDRQP